LRCRVPSCGDGYLNTSAGEACDDKNNASGDGCGFPTCALEPGFTCATPGAACRPDCGDGQVKGAEACDDFNNDACGTCGASCGTSQPAAAAIGSITTVNAANIVDGATLVISDGVHIPSTTFEFSNGGGSSPSHVVITLGTNSRSEMAASIATAINRVGPSLAINAAVNSTMTRQVLLTNGNPGSIGNLSITETVANTDFVVSGMAGGVGYNCDPGTGCGSNADCQSGVCCLGAGGTTACPCATGTSCTPPRNACLAPSCNDQVANGGESDVDCGGGGACPRCGPGLACLGNADCQSGAICRSGTCQSSCPDTVRNGNETDVDCGGGGGCPTCANGRRCAGDGDCASGSCGVPDGGTNRVCL
jgi:cysteine-rich repeat protein